MASEALASPEYVLAGSPKSPRRFEPDGADALDALRRWTAAAPAGAARRAALRRCLDWAQEAAEAGIVAASEATAATNQWLEDLVEDESFDEPQR